MSYTNPTFLAVKTASSGSKAIARSRVIKLYRDFQRCVPEMVNMYNLEIPISTVRSKVRQEFERNRYVQDLGVTDVLIFKAHAEFQELNNFWKQQTHVMKYFTQEDDTVSNKHLPDTFMGRFLEGRN
ncbi:ndufa6 NADH-ubiquinone oxidoreductase subunit [Savitreella phatthalungensis]